MIIAIVIVCALYYAFGMDYAKGMATYASKNNLPSDPKEQTWDSVVNESAELKEAVRQCSVIDIILELSDVINALIKHFIISYLPVKLYCHWICWAPIFLIVLPCTIKLAMRHKKFGCIRNHKNPLNRDHICSYKE